MNGRWRNDWRFWFALYVLAVIAGLVVFLALR